MNAERYCRAEIRRGWPGRAGTLGGMDGMAISIGDLAEVAADGWRGTEEESLRGWRLRAAGGFTGRANSALTVGDPGLPLPAAAAAVHRWYAARELPTMISVAYPSGRNGWS